MSYKINNFLHDLGFGAPVDFKGDGVFAGNCPLGKPEAKELEFILRYPAESESI